MRLFHRAASLSVLLCGTIILLSCGSPEHGSLKKFESCSTENYERISRIRGHLDEGKKFLQKRESILAIEQFRTGIEKIGYDYISPGIIDDTGLLLSLAGREEQKSNFSGAAHLLNDVLENRISLCEEKTAITIRGEIVSD